MSDAQTLADQLLDPAVHPRLLNDCARLLDAEVARKRGFSGMAIKGAYKTVQAIKPGFIRGVTELLVGEWIVELEPDYRAWRDASGDASFGEALLRQRDSVAERMLGVTDRRAQRTPHKTAKKLYFKLRPGAKAQVVEALPGVARVLDSHLGE